jgi:hypothetical protein
VVISSVPVPFGKALLHLWTQELVNLAQEEWIQRNEHAHLVSRGLLASSGQSKVAGDFRDFGIVEYRGCGVRDNAKDVPVGNKDVV